jgi:hypothetical protein
MKGLKRMAKEVDDRDKQEMQRSEKSRDRKQYWSSDVRLSSDGSRIDSPAPSQSGQRLFHSTAKEARRASNFVNQPASSHATVDANHRLRFESRPDVQDRNLLSTQRLMDEARSLLNNMYVIRNYHESIASTQVAMTALENRLKESLAELSQGEAHRYRLCGTLAQLQWQKGAYDLAEKYFKAALTFAISDTMSVTQLCSSMRAVVPEIDPLAMLEFLDFSISVVGILP